MRRTRHLIALAFMISACMTVTSPFHNHPSQAQEPLNAPNTGGLCVNVAREQLALLPQPDAQLLIVDTSGSMNELTKSGESRIELAKRVLEIHVSELPLTTNVGLRDFGNGCGQTELRFPIGPIDKDAVLGIVRSLVGDSDTPIADALWEAAGDFAGYEGEKEILLVTDGQESCGGDPVETARQLAAEDPLLSIHVVGFDIQDVTAQQNLRQIPQVANGAYIEADTESNLLNALSVVVRVPYLVYEGGALVAEGYANRTTLALDVGEYTVDVPLLGIEGEPFPIERGRGTALNVDAAGNYEVVANDPFCIARFCPFVPLPHLIVGEGGYVSEEYGDPRPVVVGREPGLDRNDFVGQMDLGDSFQVLDGPICLDGYMWWYVKNDELEGWAAEGVDVNYFLEPWYYTELGFVNWDNGACGNGLPWALKDGGRGVVREYPGATPNDLRGVPNGAVLSRIYPGEEFDVIDGPQCSRSGTSWWYVRADDGREGWTPEGRAGEYWLAPIYVPSVEELYECIASSTVSVNKRGGPSTSFDIQGVLDPGEKEGVIGQTVGSDQLVWWQLADETWVRSDLVTTEGQCANVPKVQP